MKSLDYLKLIAKPWKYKDTFLNNELVQEISKIYYGNIDNEDYVYPTINARNAMYLFIMSLDLPKGSNVVVQSFTCNAAVNPILWAGLEPRYADTAVDGFNATLESIKSVVDVHTKVVIVQHTFGVPGEIETIVEFAKENGIYVLEDCAHALGGSKGNRMLGTFGDAAVISFGLEKVLSTRVGGALILNNPSLGENLDMEYKGWSTVSNYQTFLWLINPLIWRLLRMLGGLQSKVARFLNRLGFLNLGFFKSELEGVMPSQYPRKLSGVLSKISLEEMVDLENNLLHRKEVSALYFRKLSNISKISLFGDKIGGVPFVKYPLWLESKSTYNQVVSGLEGHGVYIADWYNPVVYPASTDLKAMKYEYGVCKNAENNSQYIINLPTGLDITMERANEISEIILNSLKG